MKNKKWVKIMAIALIIIITSSFFASQIQTSFGDVQMIDLNIAITDGSYVSAYMLRPRDATSDHPLPLIMTTHGSFNNKEMQDQNWIELSRRGFVVVAIDVLRHGNSSLLEEPKGSDFSDYNAQAKRDSCLRDVLDYLCTLDFIDSTNVGLTGHSMGCHISQFTLQNYLIEQAKGETENIIDSVLMIGREIANYDYITADGVDEPIEYAADIGMIAGKYDEWMYRYEETDMDPRKFLQSKEALMFINQVDDSATYVEEGKYYSGEIDGETYSRVIYNPAIDHVLNHFSTKCAKYTIDYFYNTMGTPDGHDYISSDNQVWWIKEALNFIALLGLFVFLVSFTCLLLQIPCFENIQRPLPEPLVLKTKKDKLVFWSTYAFYGIIPPFLWFFVGYVLIGKKGNVPGTVTRLFGQQNTNELAGWTLCFAVIAIIVYGLIYKVYWEKRGVSVSKLGINIGWKKILKSFVMALLVVYAIYSIVFAIYFFFKTDFRLWVLAIKPFASHLSIFMLVYFPAFLAFYLVNSFLVNCGNRIGNLKEWQITLIGCINNIAWIIVLLIIQYSALCGNGHEPFNAMRVVNCFPMVLLVPFATVASRKIYKESGNFYLAGFIMAIFYTVVICANTQTTLSVLPI